MSIVYLVLRQNARGNRVRSRDTLVVHPRLSGLGPPCQLVRPVTPSLDVADDADGALGVRQGTADGVPSILPAAGRLINHGGVYILAVEVVRLLA